MMSKATQEQADRVKSLLAMISGVASGLTDEDRSLSPAPTLYVPPSGRCLSKRLSDVSLDSDGFPALLADAGNKKDAKVGALSASKGSKRKLAPTDAMAMAAADEDLEDFEQCIADIDALAELDDEEAKTFASSKAASSGARASASAPAVRPRRAGTPVSRTYTVMYYKANNSFGVRQLFGEKRQVLSVCKKGVQKDVLQSWAEKAQAKLNKGEEESEVKTWLQAKISAL